RRLDRQAWRRGSCETRTWRTGLRCYETRRHGDTEQNKLESPCLRASVAREGDMDSTIKDFEAAIAELETIVKKLEEGDLPLETSLQLYERGVQLSRFCHAQLEQAEKRIEILNERGQL